MPACGSRAGNPERRTGPHRVARAACSTSPPPTPRARPAARATATPVWCYPDRRVRTRRCTPRHNRTAVRCTRRSRTPRPAGSTPRTSRTPPVRHPRRPACSRPTPAGASCPRRTRRRDRARRRAAPRACRRSSSCPPAASPPARRNRGTIPPRRPAWARRGRAGNCRS